LRSTIADYAKALLESCDWKLGDALTVLRKRLTESYMAGLKSFGDLIDIAADVGQELHLQYNLHQLEVAKTRNAEIFRERYAELMTKPDAKIS
jgi:hypothetical protein